MRNGVLTPNAKLSDANPPKNKLESIKGSSMTFPFRYPLFISFHILSYPFIVEFPALNESRPSYGLQPWLGSLYLAMCGVHATKSNVAAAVSAPETILGIHHGDFRGFNGIQWTFMG